jgi:ribulose-phosphate 3-epimerase
MIEIIPTILVKNFKEVKERIKKVEDDVNWVQLDIMDGVFVNNETWPYPKGKVDDLKKIKTKLKLEAHLMVQKPEEVIDDWLKVVDRVIIHFESKITNRELGIRELIKKVHKKKKEIGLALNPETHYAVATPFLKDLDLVLFMTVQPGWGGQEFKDWILSKIKALREIWPKGNIGVDGGINDENIKELVKAGANLICAGTYVFRSKDIKKALEKLKK